jgi:hypothetical protein
VLLPLDVSCVTLRCGNATLPDVMDGRLSAGNESPAEGEFKGEVVLSGDVKWGIEIPLSGSGRAFDVGAFDDELGDVLAPGNVTPEGADDGRVGTCGEIPRSGRESAPVAGMLDGATGAVAIGALAVGRLRPEIDNVGSPSVGTASAGTPIAPSGISGSANDCAVTGVALNGKAAVGALTGGGVRSATGSVGSSSIGTASSGIPIIPKGMNGSPRERPATPAEFDSTGIDEPMVGMVGSVSVGPPSD